MLHLIDGTQEDVVGAYRTIRGELTDYAAGLAEKPEILALNKIDALTEEEIAERAAALEAASGGRPLLLSGVTGNGVKQATSQIARHLGVLRAEDIAQDENAQEVGGWQP